MLVNLNLSSQHLYISVIFTLLNLKLILTEVPKMVVGPKELKEIIEKDDKPKMERLEARIDAVLREKFRGEGSVLVDGDVFGGLQLSLVDQVLNKYRGLWDIEYERTATQDSEWYKFTPIDTGEAAVEQTVNNKPQTRSRRTTECAAEFHNAQRFVDGYLDPF